MTQETKYTIEIEMSEDAIWGPEGTDGYDVDDSLENLERNVTDAIRSEFDEIGEVEFDLRSINDNVQVFGDDPQIEDTLEREITEIISDVWQEWDWAVEV